MGNLKLKYEQHSLIRSLLEVRNSFFCSGNECVSNIVKFRFRNTARRSARSENVLLHQMNRLMSQHVRKKLHRPENVALLVDILWTVCPICGAPVWPNMPVDRLRLQKLTRKSKPAVFKLGSADQRGSRDGFPGGPREDPDLSLKMTCVYVYPILRQELTVCAKRSKHIHHTNIACFPL